VSARVVGALGPRALPHAARAQTRVTEIDPFMM
jgi:hypothetical protein